MDVYLLDGTYEFFRHFFALPPHVNRQGREVAATRGVVSSVIGMLESGVSHLGVATDHVIESFRNELWPGYKTSAGVDPLLLQQFPLLEEALSALGLIVWPMVTLEADDALGAAARAAAADAAVGRVFICSPDKDLAQCVRGERIVLLDRRSGRVLDDVSVKEKFGVPPLSIPDFLALVGDSADGFPGILGWGAKSAASVLGRYGRIEAIPDEPSTWEVPSLRGRDRLSLALREQIDRAYLFRDLATLRTSEAPFTSAEALRWPGPGDAFAAICDVLDAPPLLTRALALAPLRGG